MANPFFQNSKGENANRVSNPLNDADKTYRQGYNSFDLTRQHYTTLNYADITPFEHLYAIGGDKLQFGSKHHLRTYTLASPLLEDIFIKKSYYACDMRAILPLNWDKIYREPSVGDDVLDLNVNTFTKDFLKNLVKSFENISTNSLHGPNVFRYFLLTEDLFGSAGLLSRFGINLGGLFKPFSLVDDMDNSYRSFDEFYESIFPNLFDYETTLIDNHLGVTYNVYRDNANSLGSITWHTALDLVRGDRDRYSLSIDADGSVFISNYFGSLAQALVQSEQYLVGFEFNYAPLIAYQLVCAEYFTKDQLDNIYTSQLYHQNMRGIVNRVFSLLNSNDPLQLTFTYNGVATQFDSVSGSYLKFITGHLAGTIDFQNEHVPLCLGYLENIFCHNRSLRYGDYFTGARPEPYATVDMTSDVVSGEVSAIDVTRSILAQRFANAVARTGRRMSDYLSEITDGYDVPDVEVPRWLASKTSKVDGFEVENTTSENQGNIVTILNSSNSDFIYELEVGSPTIVIGVCTFSMPRVYSMSNERFAFHKDRYDMFNKFMQYDGDQAVLAKELGAQYTGNYAYQLRHMEYKQRYNIASGGWKSFLPAMFLISDRTFGMESNLANGMQIDVWNIRNTNSEFDPFYSSLTGYSNAARFHFLAKFTDSCSARRKMQRTPTIL